MKTILVALALALAIASPARAESASKEAFTPAAFTAAIAACVGARVLTTNDTLYVTDAFMIVAELEHGLPQQDRDNARAEALSLYKEFGDRKFCDAIKPKLDGAIEFYRTNFPDVIKEGREIAAKLRGPGR